MGGTENGPRCGEGTREQEKRYVSSQGPSGPGLPKLPGDHPLNPGSICQSQQRETGSVEAEKLI